MPTISGLYPRSLRDGVEPAAPIGRERADRGAQKDHDHDAEHADRQGDTPAGDDPREHVTSAPVGTEQEYRAAIDAEGPRVVIFERGGNIELDPASSALHNKRVRAEHYFGDGIDGLDQDWTATTVYLNPPGGERGKVQKLFYEKLVRSYYDGLTESAIYLGYSLGQLQWIQDYFKWFHPADGSLCILRSRPRFIDGKTNKQLGTGWSGAFALLMTEDPKINERFVCFNNLGMVL